MTIIISHCEKKKVIIGAQEMGRSKSNCWGASEGSYGQQPAFESHLPTRQLRALEWVTLVLYFSVSHLH